MKPLPMILIAVLMAAPLATEAQAPAADSLRKAGEMAASKPQKKKYGIFAGLYEVVKTFSQVDTNYVEPQKYNYQLMMQNINTYEAYTIETRGGQRISFAPDVSVKVGPYIGWRWIFLGYTIDLGHLSGGKNKQDFNLSLYSAKLGVDIFYRKTGNDYKIRRMELGDNIDTSPLKNTDFGGINASIKGFNLYYIFNNRKFSYPAAYSQSTRQRRSAGSALAGIGYTTHSLSVDWRQLDQIVTEKLGSTAAAQVIDSSLVSERIHYADLSVSGGYAYNWVFARNWLFDISLSLALGYKHSSGDLEHQRFKFKDFRFRNFSVDGVMRMGIVWNTGKWYAGANTIMHSYNYRKSQFTTNTYFGNVNIYVGFNFGRKR